MPRWLRSGPAGALLAVAGAAIAWYLWRRVTDVPLAGRSWRTGPALVLGVPLAAACALVPGAATLVALPDHLRPAGPAGRFATVLAAAGTLWWLSMWVWAVDATVGRLFGAVVLTAGAAVLGWWSGRAAEVLRGVAMAVAIAVGLTVAVNGVLYVHGGLGQGQDLAAAVTYATPDNLFQLEWVERLRDGEDLRAPKDIWPMTDRPPVQAAVILTAVTEGTNTAVAFQLASSFLQALAASSVAVLLVVRGLRGPRLLAAVLLVSMTIWFAYGVVFVWPKSFAAALMLAAVALALERGRSLTPVEWAAIGGCCGLSVVAHPAGALALPVLVGALVLPPDGSTRLRDRVVRPDRTTVWAVLSGAAVVVGPWVMYRTFVDSSRSLLTVWHLTGVEDPSERRPLLRLFADRMAELGPDGWIRQRVRNLSYLTGFELRGVDKPPWGLAITIGVWSPMWSGGLLWPASPALALSWRSTPERISSARLAACGAIAVALWWCVEYGPPSAPTVAHHGPTAAFLVISLAVAEVLAERLRAAVLGVVVAVQVAILAVLWWPRGQRLECGELCPPQVLLPDVILPGQIMWPTAMAAALGAGVLVVAAIRLGGGSGSASSPAASQH